MNVLDFRPQAGGGEAVCAVGRLCQVLREEPADQRRPDHLREGDSRGLPQGGRPRQRLVRVGRNGTQVINLCCTTVVFFS
jgi:hypothetical protein